MRLAETVAQSFKNLPDRISRHSFIFVQIVQIYSDTKLNLSLELDNLGNLIMLLSSNLREESLMPVLLSGTLLLLSSRVQWEPKKTIEVVFFYLKV